MVTRTSIPAHPTNYYVGRIKPVLYIVIHTGETDEGATPAEGMGNWFGQEHPAGQRSSAHRGADTDSICTYVADSNTAFGAPNVNANGWHLEHAGRAGQTTAQWDDDASRAILANGALAAAEASKRLGIPARWLTDAELRAGNVKGFITHAQASRVLGGTHWDPGPNFPADRYMALVKANLAKPGSVPAAAPVVKDDFDMTPAERQQFIDDIAAKVWATKLPRTNNDPVAASSALGEGSINAWRAVTRLKALAPANLTAAVTAAVAAAQPGVKVDDLAKAIVVELGKD